jgi:hypothetical protein
MQPQFENIVGKLWVLFLIKIQYLLAIRLLSGFYIGRIQ